MIFGIVAVVVLLYFIGIINIETGIDKGILKACGTNDWGDFEGDYPTIWIKTDNGHWIYWYKYAPDLIKLLDNGSFYSFEYGYQYMPSGCSAGDGWWVKSLSRVRDIDGKIVWG